MIKTVGKIDISMFKEINPNIKTNEVVIIDKQKEHVEERRCGVFYKYEKYIPEALINPDYIFKDNKRENTANIIKLIELENKKHLHIVLRLAVCGDNEGYKNSIITLWEVNNSKLEQLKRNKIIIYKNE